MNNYSLSHRVLLHNNKQPFEMFIEAATQMEVGETEVEKIPNLNLEVFTMTPEHSRTQN